MDPEAIRTERIERFKDDPENNKQLPLMADEIRARGKAIKQQIYETGRVLTEAKGIVGHGEFKKWIKSQEFDFSYQTANNFMNVYRYCLQNSELVQSIRASILYKIASPKFPEDLRGFLFKNANVLKEIKNKQIKDIYKRFKKKELNLDSPEILGLVKFCQKNNHAKAYEAELSDLIGKLETLGKTIVKQSTAIIWPNFPGKDRTELTQEQAQRIDAVITDMVEHVSSLKPDFKQVKRLRPRLMVSGE